MTDRAVSELVGYSIIFGMVLLLTSSIVVIGTSNLSDARDREQLNNAEVAFERLAANIQDHATDRAASRVTEIRVANAELYFEAETEYNMTVTPTGSSEKDIYVMIGDPLIYESTHGSRVVYANGAVFRENDDGSRMVREPDFRIDDSRTMLPHTVISGIDDRIYASGSRSVLIRTEQRTPRLYQNTDHESYNVTIRITTTEHRADAWNEYLNSYDELECTVDEVTDERATVSCDEYTTDEIHIPVTRLTGEFS